MQLKRQWMYTERMGGFNALQHPPLKYTREAHSGKSTAGSIIISSSHTLHGEDRPLGTLCYYLLPLAPRIHLAPCRLAFKKINSAGRNHKLSKTAPEWEHASVRRTVEACLHCMGLGRGYTYLFHN